MAPDDWAALLGAHDSQVDSAVAGHRGWVVKHEGDGTFAAFEGASDALDAAVAISGAVADAASPGAGRVRVRIGIHTGEGRLTQAGTDYLGVDVHYAARLA